MKQKSFWDVTDEQPLNLAIDCKAVMSEQYEFRFCERCMTKTKNHIIDYNRVRNPRGYATFKCSKCGRVRRMRLLRPSAESSY